MNVKSVEKNETGKLTFTVEVPGGEFEAAVNKVYFKSKKDIYVPGFRKGKAPRVVVEGMYGKDVFYDDAVNEIAPDAYEKAMAGENMPRTVGRPTVVKYDIADDKTLSLDFSVAMYPEATLGQYKGLEVYKQSADVSGEEIEKELEAVRKRNGRIVTVNRKLKDGDTANIDFDGYKDGVPFEGGKAEGYDLVIGSGSFVPGFEEQLVGLEAGDEKDIDITFPENYHEGLAGAAVVFKIKVNEVKETQLPELDDEFAKDVSEFDTLEEYKASVRENLAEGNKKQAENAFRSLAVSKAVENMTVTVPEEMIDEQVDNIVREYAQNCAMQGMDFSQYLASMGMNEQSFRSVARPSAENDVKGEILLEKVAEAEGIAVSDEDMETEYKNLSEAYGMELDKVKDAVDVQILSKDILLKKTADFICENAVITDKPEEEEDKEAEEKPKKSAKKTSRKADEKTEKNDTASAEKPAKKPAAAKKTSTKSSKKAEETEGAEKSENAE